MMGSVVKSFTGGGGKDSSKAATQASTTASQQQRDAANVASGSYAAAGTAAANTALQGSQTAAGYQQQALDYLKQADQLPTDLREQALRKLGGIFNSDPGNISQMITDRAMASPQYRTAVEQGENSVLRNASATGGLRSGNASDALAQANQNAFLGAYNNAYGEYRDQYNSQIQGLQGLASLPSNANNIAALQAGIGNTLGQGQASAGNYAYQGANNSAGVLYSGSVDASNTTAQGAIAAANAQSQGGQNGANNLFGLAGLGMQAFSTFSDRRLKSNIELIGEENGMRKYKWTWNEAANAMGLNGGGFGVMADEVEESHPDAVSVRNGYLYVDYQKLGVSHGL